MLPSVVAIDLDGVIWRASTPIPGSADAVARLQAAGPTVVFVTNNAFPDLAGHEAKLASMGIAASGAVISSPAAAASLLVAGERVLVAGGAGVEEAVRAVGAVPVTYEELGHHGAAPVDAVVAGFHQGFDYERMTIAADAVRGGARFIATNDDPTYPTAHGLVPGNGALIASVAVASGVRPTIAGKPHPPIVDLVRDRFGDEGMVIGDRPDTDGAFAHALGWDFGLVLSGVTSAADLPLDQAPALVADDLAALVDRLA